MRVEYTQDGRAVHITETGDMVKCARCGAVKVAHEGHGKLWNPYQTPTPADNCVEFMSQSEWKRLVSGEGLYEILAGLA